MFSATNGRQCCNALSVKPATNDAAAHPHYIKMQCTRAELQSLNKLRLWLGSNQHLPKGVHSITPHSREANEHSPAVATNATHAM